MIQQYHNGRRRITMDKIDKFIEECDKSGTDTCVVDIEHMLYLGWTQEEIKELFERNDKKNK